jgi:DnaA family protein
MNNSSQLALNVRLNINSTFENFFCADLEANKIGLNALKQNQEKFIYLLGSSGSGVSHLLQAVCNDSNYKGERSVYIPLSEVSKEDPETVFDGMDQFDCVCLDDLDAVIHRDNWQLEIFNLFNSIKLHDNRLVIGSHKDITNFNLTFLDLESRLKSFLSIGLTSLDDSQLIGFFSHQAKLKGMRISHGVAEFILNRVERKTHQMISILNILDEQSLEKTKMITIPFVKEALNL